MTSTHGWPRRLAPLVVSQAFLWITLGLFAFGPWDWPLRNPLALYAFVIGAHVALAIGYLSVCHRAPSAVSRPCDPNRLVRISLWINLAVLPITSYSRTGQWVPDIVGGLLNPGAAYEKAHIYTESGSNAASYVGILLAPALVMLFPLGVFFWQRLNWTTRSLTIVAMIAVVMMSIATGQRRDMADMLVTLPFVIAASHFAGVCRLKTSTIVTGGVCTLVAVVAFAAYFTYSHVSRVGQDTADYGVNPITMQAPDMDNPMLQDVPDGMRPGIVALLNYLTTGYYGLGLAIDRPMQPMYGAGHSMFLTRNVERIADVPGFEGRSLAVQISDKDGFKYPVHWCTAYPYFANDLGFIGTVLMLFFVGRGLALSWLDMLGGRNPYAVVFFSLIITLIFYLPATNRMLQDGEGVVAFYTWLIFWACSRLARQKSPALVTA